MSDIYTKVREGTKSDGTDLCKSCSHGMIRQGSRESDEVRQCRVFEGLIKNRETAIIITTDKQGRIGFVPYNKWKNDDKNSIPDEFYD